MTHQMKLHAIENALKTNYAMPLACNWIEVKGNEIRCYSESMLMGPTYGMVMHNATLLIKADSVEITYCREGKDRLRQTLKMASAAYRQELAQFQAGIELDAKGLETGVAMVDFHPVSGRYYPLTSTFEYDRADGTREQVQVG